MLTLKKARNVEYAENHSNSFCDSFIIMDNMAKTQHKSTCFCRVKEEKKSKRTKHNHPLLSFLTTLPRNTHLQEYYYYGGLESTKAFNSMLHYCKLHLKIFRRWLKVFF